MVTPATILQNILDSDRYFIVAIDCQYNLIFNNGRAQQEQDIIFGESLSLGDNLQQRLANLPAATEILEKWQNALAGETHEYTQKYTTTAQTACYYEVNFMPLRENNAIVGAMAMATEVTERIQTQQQLQVSQKILETTQYLTGVGHWQFDVETQALNWSPQVYRLCGWDEDTAPSYAKFLSQIQPQDCEAFIEAINNAIAQASEYSIDIRLNDSDGNLHYLNVRGLPILNPQGQVTQLAGLIIDINDQKERENQLVATVSETTVQLEHEMYRRGIAQNLLADRNRILRDIARDRPIELILDAIVDILETYIEEAICVIMLLNPRKTALVHGAAPHLPEPLKLLTAEGLTIGPKAGSCGTAAYRQKPVIVTDISTDPLWEEYRDAVLAYDLQSCWSLPIFDSQGDLLGTLAIYHPQKRQPRATEWKLVEQILALASIAIENRQNKRSLQDREAHFRRALMNAPFPILIHAEDGEMLLVNQAVSHLTGYDSSEIPTLEAWTAKVYGEKHEMVRSQVANLYERDLDRHADEGEFELQSRDHRTLIWYFNSASLGTLPDGRQTIISMANDITERKKLEIELSAREARLQRLFHSDMIGIGEWALSGTIVDANDTLLRLLGYDRNDLAAGRIDWQEVTPPKYNAADRQALAEIEQSGVSQPYEKEFRDRHGNLTPVLVGSCSLETPTHGFFFAIDISKRKGLERSLQRSIQRLENLRSLDLAILALQSIDEIVLEACERLEQLFDGTQVNLVILQLDSEAARWLNTPTPQHPNATEFVQLRSLLQAAFEAPATHVVGDRQQYPAVLPPDPNCQRFIGIPVCANQQCFGLLFMWCEPVDVMRLQHIEIALEISNQIAIACQQERLNHELQNYTKELEKRVAHRTAQLQEINRELEAFTYSVSHDLRAPLRAIQGFSTALYEDYTDEIDDLGRDYLRRLNEAAQKLDCLIQDLLSYSRLSRTEIQFKNLDLERIVRNTVNQLSLEIQEKEAEITISQPLAWVNSNTTILQQILVNLIQNALKFTASGVRPQIHIHSEIVGDRTVRLWVEDNGIGIDPEHQDRIFTLFERLHGSESYKGTGIGLALVSKGIERLRGQVGVESQTGQGSRFWLEIPKGHHRKNRPTD